MSLRCCTSQPAMASPELVNAPAASSRPLLFALNGSRVELPSVDPSITLLTYLRSHTPFKGTKLSCGEGGCGACLVLLSKYDVKSRKVEQFSINSCITLLCSIDGCSVTTIEGLGSTQKGFHAVQQRIAGFHGSQCGFCTPGMCMSLYACLRNVPSDNLSTSEATYTLPNLSVGEAQNAIVGNICRCTGYRPIIDACKSFAGDIDVEDLGINTFWSSKKEANLHLLPAYSKERDPVFPLFLIQEFTSREQLASGYVENEGNVVTPLAPLSIKYVDDGPYPEERLWIEASTLAATFEALSIYKHRDNVRLVVGNTSAGYYKEQRHRILIDISRIPELTIVQETVGGINVGSAVTISKLIKVLEAKASTAGPNSVPQGLASHLKKVANPHVRNRASIGGNLIMAQQFSFDSDLATLFLSIGVTIKVVAISKQVSVLSMEDFLEKGSLEYGTILESIYIPLWLHKKVYNEGPLMDDGRKRLFKSYRAAPRPLGNSLAWLNAAFLAEISVSSERDGILLEVSIQDVKLAYGAFGQSHAFRVREVEGYLTGKTVSPGNLLRAIEILKVELSSHLRGTKKANYRSSVAVGFLFDYFWPFLSGISRHTSHGAVGTLMPVAELLQSSVDDHRANGAADFIKHLKEGVHISGKQSVPVYEGDNSLGKPVQKVEAQIQAAGEAVYVDDIPSPDHCLYAAFVLSDKALAKIKSVNPKDALACPGVVTFISAADIPEGGENVGAAVLKCSENLFAADMVEYVGHPLGVVVADTPQHAKLAASKVRVDYDTETLGRPLLSIEDAVEKNSFFDVPPFLERTVVGNVEEGFAVADHTILNAEVRMGSQYYFYMETQTALAIPDEDDCMLVYNSSQTPDLVQECISRCLGIPIHNVRVITRRVGGGFGGKAFRNMTVASACAVAAYKLRKPVRMYLDRKTDMMMMGGRHPIKAMYSVGFKDSGKVTGMKAKVYIDGGWSPDFSPFMPGTLGGGMKKYDWGSMNVEFKVCKTNLSSKSAMRGPGHVQGSFISDTVLEHVAAKLGLDVHTVISQNIHTFDSIKALHDGYYMPGPEVYTLPSMWSMLMERLEARKQDVHSFNSASLWSKRGLSLLPCIYDVVQLSKPARVSIFRDGSVVVEVGGIELGQGLYTKVKQSTIYALSQLWPKDSGHLESLKVRVVQADSISMPNAGITAGSTSSEGSCEAVREACSLLVSRLMPVKLRKEQESSSVVSWLELIQVAQAAEVDLSAQCHWFPKPSTRCYLNYGVAATEVEMNILTGEVAIIKSELIYDCGKSLNPAVDIGQIEGSFVQGIGFFLTEEVEVDSNGRLLTDGTWTYKPPTLDNIPHQFSVELINGVGHQDRILSSKASGEPPLLLAGSVHSAIRRAVEAARVGFMKKPEGKDGVGKETFFQLDAQATMDKVKHLCGLDIVEVYLQSLVHTA